MSTTVAGDLYRDTLLALDDKTRQIAGLEQQLASAIEAKQRFGDIIAELRASYPQIIDLGVGLGTTSTADGTAREALLVTMVVAQPLLDEESTRVEAWLKVRTKLETVNLSVTVQPPPTPPEPAPKKAKQGR